ncbi:hypothetical protein OB2597_13093 [Pseudooceanicola batsensis HTCC2597]|uniref:Lipoprotein n=1 Tax=Pseudooceanicola batsensis (strain ATCC BAA-863 / DSM 15984 / KCTC 12145 / HTCC2597) TaxID=252305 RepID=A3TY47_PSEBH|nr:YjbF family lipoprotein [Pseudooceanicola batsensis]EAQ03081.1 hypothetical protein OB2597_13093 [Pseudooceanicola batsensis HTCC2597]
MISLRLLAAALVLALAACGNDTSQPKAGAALYKQLTARFAQGDDQSPPTRDQLRAAITPEFRAETGNKPLLLASSQRVPVSSILTMFAQNGEVRTYMTPDQISFSLRRGILIASRGLGNDLMSADVSGVLARIRAGSGRAVRVHTYLDGEDQLVDHRFDCAYSRAETGEVLERCEGPTASFTNRYTLNRAGGIAVSVQWISPGLQSYLIEDLG